MSDTGWSPLAAELLVFLSPISAAATAPNGVAGLQTALGWDLAAAGGPIGEIEQLIASTAQAAQVIMPLLTSASPSLADAKGAFAAAEQAIMAVRKLPGSWTPRAGLPSDLLATFSGDLLDYLVTRWLDREHPRLSDALALAGVYVPSSAARPDTPIVAPGSGAVIRTAGPRARIDQAALQALLASPVGALRGRYDLPASAGLSGRLDNLATFGLPALASWLSGLGLPAAAGIDPSLISQLPADQQALANRLLRLAMPITLFTDGELLLPAGLYTGAGASSTGAVLALTGEDLGHIALAIEPYGDWSGSWQFGAWQLELDVEAVVPGLIVTPAGAQLANGTAASGSVTLTITRTGDPAAQNPAAMLAVPSASGTHVEFGKLALAAKITIGGGPTALDLTLSPGPSAFVVGGADGDAFLKAVLPAEMRIPFGATVEWRSDKGLSVTGSAGNAGQIDMAIPLSLNLTVIRLDKLHLTAIPVGQALTVGADVSGALMLGPLSVTVQRAGIGAALSTSNGGVTGSANLGIVDVSLAFKPPDGIGLALSAPPVSGVGFLRYIAADARYLGAMALAVGDVAISAVGVLDTKLPGGATGYSLLIMAAAQFPPVQIGFGFSLTGIGGLVGVNRSADVPSLQALARAGRLDDLMFPADLIHRAPQVAASLATEFPAAPGHFIIGPAARVQWGTGGMVAADVGVFIELADGGGGISVLRVALLGLVHLTLPESADPVADITLDVLGVVDFAGKTLSLDAGLRNSTIATFPLTGQAALRAAWGADPAFLFAVGGFNPHFAAPAGFPALQKIMLSIGGNNPRLRLSAYLAVTSNTVQVGCAADLYASATVLGVTAAVAASLTFDALAQFHPFGLIVDLTITAAVLVGGSPVTTLSLDLHVTGPQPWTVMGTASFYVGPVGFTVPIRITAGPAPAPEPARTADLDASLTAALADPRSWQTSPPPGRGLVTVAGQPSGVAPAVHPLGTLTVREHAAPLGQRIDRYGPDLLVKPCQYDITAATIGAAPAAQAAVTDVFAPAQFLTMTDAEKLSAPSFQPMTAGTTLGSAGLSLPSASGTTAATTVIDTWSTATWDTLMLDSPGPGRPPSPPAPGPATTIPDTVLAAQLPGGAAAINGPSGRGAARYADRGSGIAVESPSYAITSLNLAAPGTAPIVILGVTSVTAGQTAATTAGYATPTQVIYTSEVPGQ